MRVNLTAQTSRQLTPEWQPVPVALLIQPSRGLPGEYTYTTDSRALLQMLKQKTDLPASVIDRFKADLRLSPKVRLLGVDLNDQVLTAIGYFV